MVPHIQIQQLISRAIFPLLQSYTDSGHRSRRRRLMSALRQNLRYQGILLGIFGLGLFYILLTVKISSFADFESLLIALANTYGLLLAIFCMGHGLVNIPRRIWQASSLDTSIREIERSAVAAWEHKADMEDEMAVISGEIASWERMCEGRDDMLANWVRELALRNPHLGERQTVSMEGQTLTENYLSSLTRRARITHNRLLKAQTNWSWILKRAGYLYDLKSATGTSGGTIEWKLSSPGQVGRIIPRNLQYLWFLGILPWLRKILSISTRLVSISIVWSEIVHNWTNPVLSLVGIVIRSTGRNWFLLEVVSRSRDG
jgi:LMBR1-like membrane protein